MQENAERKRRSTKKYKGPKEIIKDQGLIEFAESATGEQITIRDEEPTDSYDGSKTGSKNTPLYESHKNDGR